MPQISDPKYFFSGYKYIEDFILKHKKKPNRGEIVVFYYSLRDQAYPMDGYINYIIECIP